VPTIAGPIVKNAFDEVRLLPAFVNFTVAFSTVGVVGAVKPAQLGSAWPMGVVVLAVATTVPPSICAPFFVPVWVPVQLLSVPVNLTVVLNFFVAVPGESNGNPGAIAAEPVSMQATSPVTLAVAGAMRTVESASAPEPTNTILRNMILPLSEA
jgi:hypothetical protein